MRRYSQGGRARKSFQQLPATVVVGFPPERGRAEILDDLE
jgi:hypothetical protein